MNNKILKTEMVDWKLLKLLQPSKMKKMSKSQFSKLKNSFRKNGFKSPFYVWENKKDLWCLDGHTRIPILKLLEEEGESIPQMLPANFIDCKDKKEAKKAVLIYNSHYAEIQPDIFSDFISDLNLEELNSEINIHGIEFGDLFNEQSDVDAEPQLDKSEELKEKWKIKTGQVWQMGEHKILCGDSGKEEDVHKLLQGEKACLVFTDPPYGVSIGKKNEFLNSFQKAGRNLKTIESDDMKPDDLKQVLIKTFINIKNHVMSDDCTVFVTAPQGGELGMMMMMMKESGLPIRHVLMWYKNSPTFSMNRLDYDYQHEPILLTWGKKHKRPMKGNHKTSVWKIDKPLRCDVHPTMKPVELYVNALLNNSDKGDIAFDAYSGSGTMIMACEQTGRKARVVEIDPGYVAVAIQRWVDATGGTPEVINAD